MIYLCNIRITEARLFLCVSKAAYACFCMHENLHACVYANLHTPMLILSISASQKHAYAFVCVRICTHQCWPWLQKHAYACVWKKSSKYKRVYWAFNKAAKVSWAEELCMYHYADSLPEWAVYGTFKHLRSRSWWLKNVFVCLSVFYSFLSVCLTAMPFYLWETLKKQPIAYHLWPQQVRGICLSIFSRTWACIYISLYQSLSPALKQPYVCMHIHWLAPTTLALKQSGTHVHQCASKHACVNRKHHSKGTHAYQCVSLCTCMHKSITATAYKQICMFQNVFVHTRSVARARALTACTMMCVCIYICTCPCI
jgi:hypothetical protein